MKELSDMAKENGFGLKSTSSGIYFLPILNGETIDEEQYDQLSEEEKEKINGSSGIVQEKATEIMRLVRDIERDSKKATDDLNYKIGMFAIGH